MPPVRWDFISAVTEHFCQGCNRLRLTSDGRLLPCLLSGTSVDLRTPLRQSATDEELRALFLQAVLIKPRGHTLTEEGIPATLPMSHIGG
jgi:cyclic pyranopterin phosphate synthase